MCFSFHTEIPAAWRPIYRSFHEEYSFLPAGYSIHLRQSQPLLAGGPKGVQDSLEPIEGEWRPQTLPISWYVFTSQGAGHMRNTSQDSLSLMEVLRPLNLMAARFEGQTAKKKKEHSIDPDPKAGYLSVCNGFAGL